MKKAEKLFVEVQSVDCPNCGESQDGWLGDPRGGKHRCDCCGELYEIPTDIEIVVD